MVLDLIFIGELLYWYESIEATFKYLVKNWVTYSAFIYQILQQKYKRLLAF